MGRKKTINSLEKEVINCIENKDYDNALKTSNVICDLYPKKYLGYLYFIKSITHDFSIYLNEDNIKLIKKSYQKLIEIRDFDKSIIEKEYNEYINDCKEVDNLNKIRREITGKFFINGSLENKIIDINKQKSIINSHKQNGERINNIYDLINGIFFAFCMIFNLMNYNYLLIITIPFGVFGFITIYKFIDDCFIKDKVYAFKTKKKILQDKQDEIKECNDNIEKNKKNIEFLNSQKVSSISKIPESFKEYIEDLIKDDEKEIAYSMLEQANDKKELEKLISINTNLDINEFDNDIEDIKVLNISLKKNEENEKKYKLIYMKKIKLWNIILTVLLLIISIFSSIVLYKNFYELNLISFEIAIIVGIISSIIYNINTGKSKSLTDTFGDNLLSTIFKTSLIYDLIYISMTNDLKFIYGFLEIPIIFLLLLIGYVMLISLLKYNNLIKKLSKK